MRVLFATAELVPLAKVGGLGEASSGLVRALRGSGVEVDVVVPDYGGATGGSLDALITASGPARPLRLPAWAGRASARSVEVAGFGPVTLVSSPLLTRPHPYVDPDSGWGWPDNDLRFLAFSAAVGALAAEQPPDVAHLNDWHTAAVAAFLPAGTRTVLTVHNLSHQGQTSHRWLEVLGPRGEAYDAGDHVNLLAGAIRLADRVVAVSDNYAREIVRPEHGQGLHELLAAKGDDLVGIRNGIDTARWDPAHDDHLLATYGAGDLSGKELCTKELRRFAGFEGSRGPVVGLVARFVHQKGVDLALELAPFLANLPAHLVLLGAGEPHLTAQAERVELAHPHRVWFARGYDDALAHQVIAGSDLLLVPSRFEPCGLTQMEALAYGTIPVVTDVGGLHDTVTDADADPRGGTGFVAARPEPLDLLDALHRAVRAWNHPRRRRGIQQRGMTTDWSWRHPAAATLDLYRGLPAR